MASIFLDIGISTAADWDDVESAVLEQTQIMIAQYKQAYPNRLPCLGDSIDFSIEVKIKDVSTAQQARSHREIVISQNPTGLVFTAGPYSGGGANPVPTNPPVPAHGGGNLWGPSTTSPVVASTPKPLTKGKPMAIPTHIPMPPPISSSVKCFDCGKPAVLLFNSIKCSDPKCKNA